MRGRVGLGASLPLLATSLGWLCAWGGVGVSVTSSPACPQPPTLHPQAGGPDTPVTPIPVTPFL